MGINVQIYGSHDASVCVCYAANKYRIYEVERLVKQRYASLNNGINFEETILLIKSQIEKEFGEVEYDILYYGELSKEKVDWLTEAFSFKYKEELAHHISHAAGALYQSPFDTALIVSSDSGGNELEGIASFCIFHGSKEASYNQNVKRLSNITLDCCGAYTLMAVPIKEIYKEDIYSRYLSYAGKIMGLAAYGKVREEWIKPMKEFYYGLIDMTNLQEFGDKIGLDLSGINTISGQDGYDLAATSQKVFEDITIDAISPFIGKYRLPIILTGGGALNVLLNERIRKEFGYPVFVPVNPNDCGLSFGMTVLRDPPLKKQVSVTYSGYGILDIDELENYAEKYGAVKASAKTVAREICNGKVVGVINGNSECGARALGNRSILCLPNLPGIKDRINKLKQREFFRPLAPAVKLEDANKYFNFEGESEFMSFAPTVREEWKEQLSGVTHEDGTARLQTVTKEQNEFLYVVIDSVETLLDGAACVLNTSFNIKGKPILTTVKDAIEVWQTTDLDSVFIQGYLFSK